MGKFLIITGLVLLVAGLVVQFGWNIPYLGKLPGDIRIERPGFKLYFPLTTSLIISIVLTLILLLVNKSRH